MYRVCLVREDLPGKSSRCYGAGSRPEGLLKPTLRPVACIAFNGSSRHLLVSLVELKVVPSTCGQTRNESGMSFARSARRH